MGESENALPPSKKRAAGRELSRDNPGLDDEEDSVEQETGTFKRASEEVLANRRIVKVRRNQVPSTPSSNPFAGIRFVPATEPSATPAESKASTTEVTTEVQPVGDKTVSEDVKNDACKETEQGKDEHTISENLKNDTSKETDTAEDEKPVSENVDEETEEGKDENNKQSEKQIDKPVADSAADEESAELEENSNTVNEAPKPGPENEKGLEGDTIENEDKKDNGTNESADQSAEGAPLSSFQQLSSSKNAFTGLAGTGFSSSTFSFGSLSKDGSALGTGSGSLFGQKTDQPSFGFGLSNNGNSSVFSSSGPSIVSKSEGSGFPSMQEVPVETGEENEKVVFSTDSVLFEYLEGSWKERGKGELKVNLSTTGSEKARLLMRARGNYRLILNASLYPEMKLTNMDKRGITFACVNSTSEGKDGLSTFALKFKDGSIVEEFRAAVMAHKGKAAVLKTPENSPKASDD